MRLKVAVAMLAAVAFAAAGIASADGEKTVPARKARGKGPAKPGDRADDDPAASRDAKFRAWDKDGNGTLSRGEYPGHPGNFRALDRDSDGALSIEEFQHRAGAGAPPAAETEESPASPRPATGRDEEFRRLDADADGVVARGEWRGRPSVFTALDTDGNGVLSRDEYVRSARGRLPR